MYFLVTGHDYKDEDSLNRRMKARGEHMAGIEAMLKDKTLLMACAMVNEDDQMCGSTMILDMENREAVDRYLDQEAYILQKVWERVEVTPCKVPPLFLK